MQQIASPETEGSLQPILRPEDSYPKSTTDGFVYRNKEDEAHKAEWKEYENENEVMQITLRKDRKALMRQLTLSETQKARKIAANMKMDGEDQESILTYVMIHLSTTFEGKMKEVEDIKNMVFTDSAKLLYAAGELNF